MKCVIEIGRSRRESGLRSAKVQERPLVRDEGRKEKSREVGDVEEKRSRM
jgi:hypothetical protein